MAIAGQTVENPLTGERLTFLEASAETGGARLVLEAEWPPGDRAVEHLHPAMSERFEVLAGRATVRLDGHDHELGPGESLSVPPGTLHLAWNPGTEAARLRITFEPAGRWEAFVERLARVRDRTELPGLLQEFASEIRLS